MEVQQKLESPARKRRPQDEQISLDAIKEVVRGEIQGAVSGMTDRVAATMTPFKRWRPYPPGRQSKDYASLNWPLIPRVW